MFKEVLLKEALRWGIQFAGKRLSGMGRILELSKDELETLLTGYWPWLCNWSEEFQILGMATPARIEDNTIALQYSSSTKALASVPREFKEVHGSNEFTETEIADSARSILILGDPGAGKTTTVRRLVRRLLYEELPELKPVTLRRIPIVLELRKLGRDDLHVGIARLLGLPIKGDGNIPSDDIKKYWHDHAEKAIALFLDSLNAAVFLDGIDEVESERRQIILNQIESMNHRFTSAIVIATCRSGYNRRVFEGFRTIEIRPLSEIQISEISYKWLKHPEEFLNAVKLTPYQDVVTRPLLLWSLMYVFKNTQSLPERPSFVYRSVIRLLLREWDEQRDIVRTSDYAKFDPDQKLEFLSALSFELTYTIRRTRVREEVLVSAYTYIAPLFELPINQSREVMREIETHNGIIVAVAGEFEFSHLSIQEFLAAYHMVRAPYSNKISEYLRLYPAPVAVAVALSSEPSKWLAGLFLSEELDLSYFIGDEPGKQFLTRLAQERPLLQVDIELGYSLVKLISDSSLAHASLESAIERLCILQNMELSIAECLSKSIITIDKGRNAALINPLWNHMTKIFFRQTERLSIPIPILLKFYNKYGGLLNFSMSIYEK